MKYNENFLNNNSIFIGKFNDKEKNGIIYFINGSYFECEWINDNIIDETKIGKLYINNLNKIFKKLKTEEWIKLIKKEFLIYYGNNQINQLSISNIK